MRTRATWMRFASWIAAGAACGGGTNLVNNPGFEEAAANGKPLVWGLPAGYVIDTNAPHSGAACLRYGNADPAQYRLATAPIRLEPGARYEIEARVRTEGVAGDERGATVCLQWSDAAGTFIGGCYPPGLQGTSGGWRTVRGVTGIVPSNAARMSVSCYLRRGMTGTAWWDDVVVRPWFPPLIGALTTDHHRHHLTGGVARVHVSLALDAHRVAVSDAAPVLRVLDGRGTELASVAPRSVDGDSAAFDIDSTPWPAGALTIEVSARGAGGTEARARLAAVRAGPPPPRKATIDGRGRLILDGEPFFPLGMYWGAVKPDEMAIYAKSPFNCLMPYADIGRAGLDLAHSNGMRVIYSVKDLYAGHRGLRSREAADAAVRTSVGALRDHPAIAAWYINDEFPLERLDELSARQRLMEELDPGRPTWSVLYQIDDLRAYLPTADVLGTDPYPVPATPPRKALDWARKSVRATFDTRAVWMVPQVFNWASYKKTPEERARQRAPTLDEMRSMAWSCIAAGADGLIFYSWFDLWRLDKPPGTGGRAETRDPFEARWRDVTAMAAEIRAFIPVLLSDEPAPAAAADGSPDTVAWRTFRHGGKVCALCLNAHESEAADVRLKIDGVSRIARVVQGPAPAPGPWDGRLSLPPLAVTILEVAP
ncbi:MAG: hypothetical protein FJ221_02385 [Lentisphaerae bacterium]|nr:hypothetical protein [Lentisphaerota bacterium]